MWYLQKPSSMPNLNLSLAEPLLQKTVLYNAHRSAKVPALLLLLFSLGVAVLWTFVAGTNDMDGQKPTISMAWKMQPARTQIQANQLMQKPTISSHQLKQQTKFTAKIHEASKDVLDSMVMPEKATAALETSGVFQGRLFSRPLRLLPKVSHTPKRSQWVLDAMYKSFRNNFLNVNPGTGETQGWATVVEGKIPVGLTGTLMRNGPALFERNGFKKAWLDGDGMVASLAFKDGKAYFRNKFVRTPGFVKEEEQGAFSELSVFTAEDPRPAISGKSRWYHRLVEDILMGPPSPKSNGAYNVWYWGGSLVAVAFDKPYALDKHTLDTVQPYSQFSSEAFTAHSRPMAEPDGSKRLCCVSPYTDWAKRTQYVTFKEFDETGQKVVESKHEFQAAFLHDMVVTDQWYILFDSPVTANYKKTFIGYPMGDNGLGDTIEENKSRPPVFRLFPRPGKNNRKPVVCTVHDMWAYAAHHVNGFDLDETGNKVVFDTITWDYLDMYFEDIVKPDGKKHFPRTKLTRFTIDTETATATGSTLMERPCEAPTVAPGSTGVPYAYAYMTTSSCYAGTHWHDGCSVGPMHSLTKVSISSARPDAHVVEDSWVPSDNTFVGEPLFTPRPDASAEDDGWLLMPLHIADGPDGPHTQIAIVDAQRVADGPVARVELPTYVPSGVHGSFTEHYILGPNDSGK